MTIYIVGNVAVEQDSLPHKLIPILKKHFRDINFIYLDPSESIIPEEGSLIIDTVIGIKKVKLFKNLDQFMENISVSVHDYDLFLHIMLLQKLKKIANIAVLGLPVESDLDYYDDVILHIRSYFRL